MRAVELDASFWKTELDFYYALIRAIGGPDWHGESVDALLDTMIWHDDINEVIPPYKVVVRNTSRLPPAVMDELRLVQFHLRQACAEYREQEGRDREISMDILA